MRGALLLLAAALAGCLTASHGTHDPQAASAPSGPQAGGDVLRGVVVDAAIRPLGGASVQAQGFAANATTGDDGAFALRGLPTDRFVVVTVSKPGYAPLSKQATLSDQQETVLDFVLQPVPGQDPSRDVVHLTGFFDCEAGVQAGQSEQQASCGTGAQSHDNVTATAQGPLAGAVAEVFWRPNTPLATSLGLRVERVAPDGGVTLLGDVEGPSPLRLELARAVLDQQLPNGGDLRATVRVAPDADQLEASVAAGLAFQQSFDAYVTLFYVKGPDPTYSIADQ